MFLTHQQVIEVCAVNTVEERKRDLQNSNKEVYSGPAFMECLWSKLGNKNFILLVADLTP